MSIHIVAEKGSIAPTVLLPGDPLRARHIAQTYLTEVTQYNEIRGMFGFTGYWQGNRVSVQGTGMGMPSFSIYANELIDSYGANRLVRVGTCGTMSKKLQLKDILIAQAADCDSAMNASRFGTYQYAPTASFELLCKAYEHAKAAKVGFQVGNVFTSDQFYDLHGEQKKLIAQSVGTMAIDMETCELYTLAHLKGVQALTLLTVSDSLLTGEQVNPKERQSTFDAMVDLALLTLFD
ncbi:purine-nucleoside phosphorylase [Sphaerochaeta globosa]|uniref:Uridine phosphorylase n=1 Tax=Sphaerochaeta globosa (strain ATCC BAA-1886 / DSM 22777 / Buddy) TaxID=158189 RepID=F0RYU5_SPHGB|nr:purine-nucleoside phosphorylase [Sphaerochaeta globosa]ADY13081.1 Purine nucleoside phosphorylase deoD-type [Sphaerochaeta globosa str. Buddy]